MKKFLIIDGNAYIHRAYHALPLLFTSNNQQVNAVYGFIKLLFKIKNSFKPDYIAVCFDYPSKNFRHEIFKDYKANRKSLDDALINQMPIAREAVKALSIAEIEIKGYEADDLIATLTENNKRNSVQTIIVTGDKDILQLAEDENVLIWNDSKDIMYNRKKVEEKYGVAPEQLASVFALMGDIADNVPGIKGIGEKTAVKLVKEFGHLENILKNANFVKGNVGKLLQQGINEAVLSAKLIKLDNQVSLDYKLENFENKDLDKNKAVSFFKKYDFKSLLEKHLDKNNKIQIPVTPNETQYNKDSEIEYRQIHAATATSQYFPITEEAFKFESEIVTTCERAVEIAKIMKKAETVAIKTIGHLANSLIVQIAGISLCIENKISGKTLKKSFYFPVGHNDLTARQMTFDDFKEIFKPIFSSCKIKKIGHDLKQEKNIYNMLGVELNNIFFDVMLASYCINPAKSHNITNISKEYLNFTAGDETYLGRGIKKVAFADTLIEDSAEYANSITAAVFAIHKILDLQIREKNFTSLFFDIEIPLIEVLSEMELSGIKVDLFFLHNFNEKIVSELKKIEKNIYKIADNEFNINSPKQLSSIMFKKLNLPVVKKTKTGYSTDEAVLTELSSYKFPVEVLKYRELQKLKSTYIDPITNYCTYCDDKVHTIFNQAVTATGRLSSTEPNLQNIPIRSDYGKEFRKAFVPERNKIFISTDYSQIDLRVLAHISEDKKLIEAFKKGLDIHSTTAREIFGIPNDQPLPENLRNAAKSINFGIIYGMSPFSLSKQLNISFGQAKEYIDGYFDRYIGVKLWMKQIVEQASKNGYVCTITGRVRYIPELQSKNVQIRNAGKRIALNMPIQGSSADIIKIAMINIYNEL
ncbi:MAG: DNA polymerase I, partial [Endomicrobium sp.]|nr:DNA polymerase I [Endomicrobium sp.]